MYGVVARPSVVVEVAVMQLLDPCCFWDLHSHYPWVLFTCCKQSPSASRPPGVSSIHALPRFVFHSSGTPTLCFWSVYTAKNNIATRSNVNVVSCPQFFENFFSYWRSLISVLGSEMWDNSLCKMFSACAGTCGWSHL